MRYYSRYRRRDRYDREYANERAGYRRSTRRGVRIEPGTLKFIALGVVLFVLAAILLHLTR